MRLFTLLLLSLLFYSGSPLTAQAFVNADASSGGAYSVISAAGFGIEGPDASSPDCGTSGPGNHSSFGDHILQAADAELGQNVFVFYSHLPEDNDRCVVFDRARIEIKGGPSGQTDPELEHAFGDTTFYRWQFRLPEDFVGASSFTHLFQSKAAGGNDSGFPILTLTARATRLELLHNGGDGNPAGTLGNLADANLSRFRGNWVEVSMRQVHTNNGELEVSIYDVETGLPILLYASDDIDLWRGDDGATNVLNRPKWGIYRSYNDDLKDETVRFANFCSSENGAAACPSIIDFGAGGPAAISGLLPLDGSRSIPLYMPIVWNASPGATSYNVYLGTSPTELMLDTSLTATGYQPELEAGTTYYYQVGSLNDDGEVRSDIRQFTTLANPDDGSWNVARGHARPDVEAGQFFELNTDLEMVGLDTVERLEEGEGNNAYCYFSGPKEDGNGNYRWRYRQDDEDETTVVVRLRALEGENNISFIEFYGLGWRQKLRVNRSTIRFERTPDDPEVAFPDGYWDDGAFHTIRATFANDPDGGSMLTTIYLDEEPMPFAGPFPSDEEKESAYVDIGRAGSTDYGACFDYIAINPTGAYAPGSGAASTLPADLAGDAALAVSQSLPLDGSVDIPLYMPIVFEGVEGAETYSVYLGTDPDNLILDTTLTANSYVPELQSGTTYYYQIASVNDQGETFGPVIQFTTLSDPDDGNWEVARGHARPEVEAGQFFEFDTNLEMVGLDSVARVDTEAGNNAYCYFSGPKEDDKNNYRWRYRQDDGEETTLILRLRALPDVSNIAYIEFYGLGWRQKLRINRSTLKFEKTTDDPEVAFPDGYWDDGDFHSIRVTFANNPQEGEPMITTVYLDEHAFPFGSYPSDEEKEGSYLDIGRAGGTDYGACIDYIAINPTGVYAPGDGAESVPPADLELAEPITSVTTPNTVTATLFPNPTTGRLYVADLPATTDYRYRIVSAAGALLFDGRLAPASPTLDVSELPAGIYFLILDGSDGSRGATRFMKR